MEKVRNPSKHSDPKFCQMKNPRYGHFYCVVVLLFEISQYFIKFLYNSYFFRPHHLHLFSFVICWLLFNQGKKHHLLLWSSEAEI